MHFKTTDNIDIGIKKLSVDEALAILQRIRPDLAKVMKAHGLDDLPFYKVSYPFGSPIINAGKCYLPLANGESIDFNSPKLPGTLANDLNYDPLTEDPLAIILSKNSEFYLPTGSNIMSHAIIHPGEMYGIPKAVDPEADSSLIWNLNAGIRYLFTLSRVTSKPRHNEFQKAYGIKTEIPLSPSDQWETFVQIARGAKSEWVCEVLYFPRKLINLLKTSAFVEMSDILQKIRRESYNIWHNTAVVWDAAFNSIETQKYLTHYSSYALSTARQLYLIAANSATGFRPATDENSAPIKLFQEAYLNVYGLADENQNSVIMETTNLIPDDHNPVYYSLNCPTLAKHNPDTFKGKSLITLLDDVERITAAYQDRIPLNQPRIKSLYNASVSTSFSFYHSNSDPKMYKNILNHEMIAQEDARFTRDNMETFAASSQFFKGCIKIWHK
ncbi:MAG: hypothetical protein K0R14_1317 [Burkholderiales bacterium]|jgi:hypothetical protein|nr:hypothetical protein [Burkholderiales bacterium]